MMLEHNTRSDTILISTRKLRGKLDQNESTQSDYNVRTNQPITIYDDG